MRRVFHEKEISLKFKIFSWYHKVNKKQDGEIPVTALKIFHDFYHICPNNENVIKMLEQVFLKVNF